MYSKLLLYFPILALNYLNKQIFHQETINIFHDKY